VIPIAVALVTYELLASWVGASGYVVILTATFDADAAELPTMLVAITVANTLLPHSRL
jgi:hypothetical protein